MGPPLNRCRDLKLLSPIALLTSASQLAAEITLRQTDHRLRVEIDGKLLVHGLVSNNVPVDVVRAMGADIVIAVDVGSGLYTRDEIKGVLDVVGQLTNILSDRNVEQQLATLKPTDILIRPALGKMGAGDFNNLTRPHPPP